MKKLELKRWINKLTSRQTGKELSRASRDIILRDEALPFVDHLIEMAKKKRSLWLFSDDDGTSLKDISNIRGIRQHINKNTRKIEHRHTK
jgi:hypothetical protein